MKKYHVSKGDKVQVIAGDWKGEAATIKAIVPEKDRVVVEFTAIDAKKRAEAGKKAAPGMRTVAKRHRKQQDGNPGLIARSVSVHVSNVALTEEGQKAKTEKQAAWRSKKSAPVQE